MHKLYLFILITCFSVGMANGQHKVKIYGQVTDVNNQPVDRASVWLKQPIDSLSLPDKKSIFENRYETLTDSNGYFSMEVDPGIYYCLYAIYLDDYGKTKLEYWAWNLPLYQDLEINPRYDRMEIYGMNAFEPQRGPFNTYMVYFRPMSLTKALNLPEEITADTIDIAPETITADELNVTINGIKSKVVAIDKIREYTNNDTYIYGYIIQVLKPNANAPIVNKSQLVEGYDKITIELVSKETNELGVGDYFIKKIGN